MDFKRKNVRLIVSKNPVNMHRSFNGLLTIAISELNVDIQHEFYVLFMNRDRNQFKILFMVGGHIAIFTMRLSGSLKADFTKLNFIYSKSLFKLMKGLACRKSRLNDIVGI